MGRGISQVTCERLDAIRAYAEENKPVTVNFSIAPEYDPATP